MHKLIKIFAFCAVSVMLMSCCEQPVAKMGGEGSRADRIVHEMNNPNSTYVLVASHRGDWRNYPENSIPAIESVIRMGVDIMELDLKLTKDSVLVLSHDKTIDRMTNGKGLVSDYTLAELKEFKLKRAHNVTTDSLRITTFREALEVCKDRIVINVDHAQNYYDEVLKETEAMGMTGQVLMKGKKTVAQVAEDMAKYENNLLYMPIIDINKDRGRALYQEYKTSGVVPMAYEVCWQKNDDEVMEFIRFAKETGSKVWLNTLWLSLCGGYDDDKALEVGADEIYGHIVDMGATMIQTDRPEFLIEYLRSRGLHE